MTDTITIRPTAAAELESGLLVRHHGETRQILRVSEYDKDRIVIYFHDGSDVRWADAMVDVVVPPDPEPVPEPEPEAEAWPTAPIIRILDGYRAHRDIGGAIALRAGMNAYRLYAGGDEVGLILNEADDGIEQWEALSVVPTEAVRTLADRLSALDIASPLSRDAALARVVDVAESLVQVADTAEAVD